MAEKQKPEGERRRPKRSAIGTWVKGLTKAGQAQLAFEQFEEEKDRIYTFDRPPEERTFFVSPDDHHKWEELIKKVKRWYESIEAAPEYKNREMQMMDVLGLANRMFRVHCGFSPEDRSATPRKEELVDFLNGKYKRGSSDVGPASAVYGPGGERHTLWRSMSPAGVQDQGGFTGSSPPAGGAVSVSPLEGRYTELSTHLRGRELDDVKYLLGRSGSKRQQVMRGLVNAMEKQVSMRERGEETIIQRILTEGEEFRYLFPENIEVRYACRFFGLDSETIKTLINRRIVPANGELLQTAELFRFVEQLMSESDVRGLLPNGAGLEDIRADVYKQHGQDMYFRPDVETRIDGYEPKPVLRVPAPAPGRPVLPGRVPPPRPRAMPPHPNAGRPPGRPPVPAPRERLPAPAEPEVQEPELPTEYADIEKIPDEARRARAREKYIKEHGLDSYVERLRKMRGGRD